MGVLDKAIEHFESQERIKIVVPEWGDENDPLVFFSDRVTLADRSECFEKAGGINLTFYVYLIIKKAINENGQRIFSIGDKANFMRKVDPNVVQRIGLEIARITEPEEIDLLGK